MTQTDAIRRRPDGSIDLDFYRTGATALRRQAMQDARRLTLAGYMMTGWAAVLGLTILIASLPGASTATAVTAGSQPIDCSTPGAIYDPSSPCWLLPHTEQARQSSAAAGRMAAPHTLADRI
jgi:hypothetical protein